MPFLVASINVALPTMAREFNMEAVVMSWVGTVYFLAIAMVQVPCGRLADIFGRRKMFIIGLLLAVVGSFLSALATSVPMLIISRVIQGIGAGMSFNNSIAILTTTIPSQERGRALGITMAGTYLGLSLGPFIGGILTRHLGWQSIFYLSGILILVLVGLVFWALRREWIEARGEKFDLAGSVTFAVSLAAFMYGFSELPNTALFVFTFGGTVVSIPAYAIFIIGIAGLVFFVWWENRVNVPVYDLSIFRRNRVFTLSSLAALITYVSTFAVTFLLSLYLQYVKDFEPDEAGLVLIAASVLMTAFTPISGRISDKIEPRLVASVGLAINCLALFLLIFVGSGTSLWYIILALAFYGIGIGLFSSPNSNAIMGSVENRILGVASGTLGTTRTAGMMMSMGIMMVLFSIYVGSSEITREVYPEFLKSMRVGFIIFTVIAALGFVTQIFARKKIPAGNS
jgi:EmrB/QacA subfamily drug resistance transporter